MNFDSIAEVHVRGAGVTETGLGDALAVPSAHDQVAINRLRCRYWWTLRRARRRRGRLARRRLKTRRQRVCKDHCQPVRVGIGLQVGKVPTGRSEFAGVIADFDEIALTERSGLITAEA